MKAVVCPHYGGPEVLEFRDSPMPDPAADEVRVRVLATSVTAGDSRMRAARVPPGMGLIARPFLGFRGPPADALFFKATKDTFWVRACGAFVASSLGRSGAARRIASEVAQFSALLPIGPSCRYGAAHD
jgi:hypothetical protein